MDEVLTIASTILGIIIAITTLIGVVYKFYIWRRERYISPRAKQLALKRYISSLIQELSLWRGLGLERDISLEQIYVSHRMAIRSDRDGYEDEKKRVLSETRFLDELLNGAFQKALVLGKAGSGKTTFARKLALALARRASPKEPVPVYLSLGEFGLAWDIPLVELIATQFLDSEGRVSRSLVKALLDLVKLGKLVIFLDGADEVQEDLQPYFMQWLKKLQRSIGQCSIVLTSRPSVDYLPQVTGFVTFQIEDFQMNQIESFVEKWFSNGSKNGAKLIEEIKRQPRLGIMASNPLFLTMICIEFERNETISPNPGRLFDRFILILLRYWDEERKIRRSHISIPIDLEVRLLGFIAYNTHGRINISASELTEYIRLFLKDFSLSDPPDAVLKEIETSGILRRTSLVSGRYYHFWHKLFQDFLIAKHVIEQIKQNQVDQESWIKENFFRKEFDDVVAFFYELDSPENVDGML